MPELTGNLAPLPLTLKQFLPHQTCLDILRQFPDCYELLYSWDRVISPCGSKLSPLSCSPAFAGLLPYCAKLDSVPVGAQWFADSSLSLLAIPPALTKYCPIAHKRHNSRKWLPFVGILGMLHPILLPEELAKCGFTSFQFLPVLSGSFVPPLSEDTR